MTYQDIYEIAKKLDKNTQKRIDKEVEERLKILEEGELTDEQMEEMEDCMYVAFVLQEYLNSEYEILDEERLQILSEMEDLYNEYVDMLARARIEEKVSKKKRMTLQLMQIREQLFGHKDHMKNIKNQMDDIQKQSKVLDNLTSKENMKNVAKENKEALSKNRDQKTKVQEKGASDPIEKIRDVLDEGVKKTPPPKRNNKPKKTHEMDPEKKKRIAEEDEAFLLGQIQQNGR